MISSWISFNSENFWRRWFLFLSLGIALILLSVFFVDQQWALYFGSPEMTQVWLFHRHITEVGSAEPYIGLALLGLLIPKFRKKGAYLLACLLASGLALHIIKFIVGRERPHQTPEHNPLLFAPFNFHDHWQSFPSGHSQTLFSFTAFVLYLFPKSAWVIVPLAVYFSFTRAFTLAHFVSDVWGGVFLGFLVSVVTLRLLVRRYGA